MKKELIYRILSSLLLIPLILYPIWAGGIAFYILMLLGFVLILREWFRMAFKIEDRKIAISIAGVIYFLYAVFALYQIETIDEKHNISLFALFIAVWLSDIFAYVSGKSLKGPKIIEKISPNKTWAGFIGAVIFPVLFFILLGVFGLYDYSYLALIVMGVLIGLASQLGDFLMSSVKRRSGVKDTGTLIPGHGGLLDRVDSLIMAAPVFYSILRFLG